MNLESKAEWIAGELARDGDGIDLKYFDPATVALIVTILKTAWQLLKWWKPEWFLSFQVNRIVKRETRGTDLESKSDKLKSLVLKELKAS